MNAKNAEQRGREDGRIYQKNCRDFNNSLTKDEYKNRAQVTARRRSSYVKTQQLYIDGFMSAWEEPKPAPVVEHFESRFDFCTCEACNAKRAN